MTVDNGAVENSEMIQSLQVLCKFCSSTLYDKPSKELIEGFTCGAELFLEEPFASMPSEPGQRLYQLFSSATSHEQKDALLKELQQDHTYLFYMVGVSRTSPYESVYRTDDRTLFGPSTLEVRNAYRQAGLELATNAQEPDDHIGLEFAFLTYELGELLHATLAGEEENARLIEDRVRTFLAEHILVFGEIYLQNLKTRAQTGFYRAIADVAQDTLTLLSQEFSVLPAESLDKKQLLFDGA